MTERVSVALCTHNGSRFIEAQVSSILAQQVLPSEIVVSDDASTDDTVAIVRRIAGDHPEVSFVVLQNPAALGVTANFEGAIRACTGDLIALCDQDDVWHPNRLSAALREFGSRPGLDLLFGDARLVGPAGEDLHRSLFAVLELTPRALQSLNRGDGFRLFLQRNLATGATVMFRRRPLERALPFPSGWVHDEWLAIMSASLGQIGAINEALIDYRQHSSNQIGVAYPTLRRKVQRVLEARGNRNARLALQFAQFAERLETLGALVPVDVLERARAKAKFEATRAALPASRMRRIGPVFSAFRRGWYSDYASQGRLDVLRDLLQAH